jgi:hypothetical protein
MTAGLPISSQLCQEFHRNRYVVVPKALPPKVVARWQRQAQVLSRYAETIQRNDGEFSLIYRVVSGETIRDQWPELFEFYQDQGIREWIRAITGESAIFTSAHLQSAINLNIMDRPENIYRWHFDAVPYTVLLYLTDVRPKDGGALELIPVRVWPPAGSLLLMDGTRCYHHVAQLLRRTVRYSIPMVYPNAQQTQRPAGLDSYLYQPAA